MIDAVKTIRQEPIAVITNSSLMGREDVREELAGADFVICKLNVRDLDMMQIATHPLLTSAPTVHPLINAAHQALAKLRAVIK